MIRILPCLALFLLLPLGLPAAKKEIDAPVRAAMLAPLLEEETFALVRIDVPRVDIDGLLKTLTAELPARKELWTDLVKPIGDFVTAFTKAGGTELVIGFSTTDLPRPSFVRVPVRDGADVAVLTRLLKERFGALEKVEKQGDALLAGSASTLDRLAKAKPSRRGELTAALTAAGGSAVQVLLLPTNDQRKVINEVVTGPEWPVAGTTLTRGVRWAALGADIGKPGFRLTLHSADGAAARQMADLLILGLTRLEKVTLPGEEKPLGELFPKLLAATVALKPTVDGEEVTIQVRSPGAIAALTALANDIEERSSGGERSVGSKNLKSIALAFHHYLDATGTFPAHAIYSKAGKPLLSWRVAILPYVEQGQLYNQFKLDEPWDSEHNKTLIARIPAVYRSPKIRDRRPGLTTYLVPINKDFVFTGKAKGVQIKDIEDGTSNTVVVVDAADESGVIWTKPDDLVVDEKDPWKGLVGHYPTSILVGMGDGSVQRVPKKVPGRVLWALFTRAGGEVIPDLSK
jgi:hypothetical protein